MTKNKEPDRWPDGERRSSRRYSVTIEIEWERNGERLPGTISDLSHGGCFVLTGARVQDGEEIAIFIPIGDGMKVHFDAVVTNHFYEIGFAAGFTKVSEAQINVLTSYFMTEENSD